MLCQNCQKRLANVHFTHTINNEKTELYLCEQCAREKGNYDIVPALNISDFLSGLIGINPGTSLLPAISRQVVCEKCGMSIEEFQKTGKLGCSECYKVLGDRLDPVVKRIHGNLRHNGKKPGRMLKTMKAFEEIMNLKELLNKAIKSEEYEKAAELRDKIKSLEAQKQ